MGTSVERTTNVQDLSKLGSFIRNACKSGKRNETRRSTQCHRRKLQKEVEKEENQHFWISEHSTIQRTFNAPTHRRYRTKEEVAEWQEQDPIEHCQKSDRKEQVWMTEKEFADVAAWVKKEVDESIEFD